MNRKQRRATGAQSPGAGKGKVTSRIVHAAAVRSAESLLGQKKWAEAADLYRGILRQEPGNAAALYNLGALLAGFHGGGGAVLPDEMVEAANLFTRYLQLKPGDADTMAALAFVRMSQGRVGEALPLMAKARRGNPSPMSLTRMGHYYKQAGEMAEAEDCFLEALRRKPEFASAYYGLSSQKGSLAADSPRFAQLLALAERKELTVDDRVYACFALASSYLASGDADKAFAHYETGNRLKRDTYSGYSLDRFERRVDGLASLFSKDFVAEFRSKGVETGRRPVFIVGMPRSGSTLVDQILSSHEKVGSIGESPFFTKSIPPLQGGELPGLSLSDGNGLTRGLVSSMSPAVLKGIAQKYYSLVAATGAKGGYIVDKMLFNYLWVGVIRLALPEAKIIHCTRDPHDIGLSIWQLLFTADMPWAYDLAETGRYYKAYRKAMTHWNTIFPGEIHEVNYETMVQDQEGETRKLLGFCELPWDDRCLRFYETKRAVQTASHAQVRKPLYKDSLAKWKKYEKYLEPLVNALRE